MSINDPVSMRLAPQPPNSSSNVAHGLLAIRPGDPIAGTTVTFDVFHQFDRETYDRYSLAFTRVADAYDGDLSIYASAALDQLNNLAKQIEELSANMSAASVTATRSNWYTAIAGAVLMFCTATHLYQEQTEAVVARHFGSGSGSGSGEHNQIRRRFNNAFDSSFGYRVIDRLRNVLVHHSMRSIGFRLSAQLECGPEGHEYPVSTLHIPLERAIFLDTKKGVSTAIRNELNALDTDPDIRELAQEALDAIPALRRDSMSLIHPNLDADCLTMNELSNLFPPWSEADRALVQLSFKDGVPQFPHVSLRPEIFDYATSISPMPH